MQHDHPESILVLSHLRWDFVFQRPQHLLTRFARNSRVFYVEEPVFGTDIASLEVRERQNGVRVVVPHLPEGQEEEGVRQGLKALIDRLVAEQGLNDIALWYYTPMAIPFTRHLKARTVVYDCMDELSLFQGAHPQLLGFEAELFKRADVVFTGGQSLYEAKRLRHPNVHAFPSSIDFEHFQKARGAALADPADQRSIPRPRIGFYGVIDERLDIDLLAGLAQARPGWQLVILGPVVKISPESLPRHANIHYLGQKSYSELPAYIAHWDVAMLPFARNESTRFISPTKTPEYLAAGKPVVSTSITDVIRPYGETGLVYVADQVGDFVRCVEGAFELERTDPAWAQRRDAFLAQTSWDKTWQEMALQLQAHSAARAFAQELRVS